MENSNQCGSCKNCCTGTLVQIKESDILRWKKEQRYDILICLETWSQDSIFLMHKKTNEECIFLERQGCSIYATSPIVCRNFPYSLEQKRKYNCIL